LSLTYVRANFTMARTLSSVLVLLTVLTCAAAQESCSPTWQERRDRHVPTDLTGDATTLRAVAEGLADDDDLDAHLEAVLVERPVESANHAKVREHIVTTLRALKWDVEEDSFESSTPVGDVGFVNVVAVLNPEAPRRLVIGI
jgi:hypothetical protein